MGEEDAINALAHTLDALDFHIRRTDDTIRRSERNRLSMLHVHAVCAMFIAPLFMLIGPEGMRGPIWVVARLIPGAPYTLGLLLFIGGAVLAVATWYRVVAWEIVGLWILLGWYSLITLSFAAAVLLWFTQGAPGTPPAARPAMYAPVVYLHFSMIMGVHLRTLYRFSRGRRR